MKTFLDESVFYPAINGRRLKTNHSSNKAATKQQQSSKNSKSSSKSSSKRTGSSSNKSNIMNNSKPQKRQQKQHEQQEKQHTTRKASIKQQQKWQKQHKKSNKAVQTFWKVNSGKGVFFTQQQEQGGPNAEGPNPDPAGSCWTPRVRAELLGAKIGGTVDSNNCLRCVRPDHSGAFAHRHDASVWECLRQILRITPDQAIASTTASLPFFMGGLGLTAAFRSREGAHWASWADCLPTVRERHPSGRHHGARAGQGYSSMLPCSPNVRDTFDRSRV